MRLYDPTGQEVGNTESLEPDPSQDIAMRPRPIKAAVDDKHGVWSITAAVTYLMRLHIDDAMPFYSLSRNESFDPTQYGSFMQTLAGPSSGRRRK